MHACDIIGYTCDGAIVCPDCFDGSDNDPEVGVIFADNADDTIGSTCDTCGACYCATSADHAPDWWTDAADSCRWSTCAHCNAQKPHPKDDVRVRLAARRGVLTCDNCRRPAVHF